MQQVNLSRGLFARQRREKERRERNKAGGINELLSSKCDTLNVLAHYKFKPEILPFLGELRRVPLSCKTCIPIGRENVRDDDGSLGIGNCFLLDNRNAGKPAVTRMFAELIHFWDCGGRVQFPKAVSTQDVLTDSKFKSMKDGVNDKAKVQEFVDSLSVKPHLSWFERLLLRCIGWFFSKIFGQIFDGICYHKETFRLLQLASELGLPIIYVPLCKSTMDSFIFKWFLLTTGCKQLPIAIEPREPMMFPMWMKVTTFLGGLITSKSSSSWKSGETKAAAFFTYLRLSLQKGNSFQFGLEAHRSRTGKPSTFLHGGEFLSLIIDMQNNTKQLEDAFIVPLSISYEKLPEEYILGNSQEEPTRTKCTRFSWKHLLNSYLGFARIDLSQPFRLRDFKVRRPVSYRGDSLAAWDIPVDSKSTTLVRPEELQWCKDVGSVPSVCSLYGEVDPLSQVEIDDENQYEVQDLQEALVQHILYDALKTTTFMSTNMLSFLLLKKFRSGISFDLLVHEMNSLRSKIMTLKRDIGFTADIKLATERAIHILGSNLVSCARKENGELFVSPDLSTESVLKLGYYANSLVQLFIREACVSTAILAMVGMSYKAVRNTSYSISSQEESLIRSSLQVSQLMKGEFILNPPCETTETIVKRTIDEMNDSSLIYIHKKKEYVCADDYDDDDLDDFSGGVYTQTQTVKVDRIEFLNEDHIWDYHFFLRNLVVPYLELYRVGIIVLMKFLLPDKEKEEIELRQEIISEAKALLKTSKYFKAEEVITVETARNFLYHFQAMGIIGSYSSDETNGRRFYYVEDMYYENNKMQLLLGAITSYITYE